MRIVQYQYSSLSESLPGSLPGVASTAIKPQVSLEGFIDDP